MYYNKRTIVSIFGSKRCVTLFLFSSCLRSLSLSKATGESSSSSSSSTSPQMSATSSGGGMVRGAGGVRAGCRRGSKVRRWAGLHVFT